jgi:hypothetical protein
MKRLIIFSTFILFIFAIGCNQEDAIAPSADFTTNLQNNTVKKGKGFTIYFDNVQGEFLVYFKGATEATTYSATDPTRLGTPISTGLDSLVIPGYSASGDFVFTVIASSSGNWAEDYLQDVKSITIKVED